MSSDVNGVLDGMVQPEGAWDGELDEMLVDARRSVRTGRPRSVAGA